MTDPRTARGPQALLDDYAAIARRRGPAAIEQTGIRIRSLTFRDIPAHMATEGRFGHVELASRAEDLESLAPLPRWLAALGRLIGLQNILPDDHALASRYLEYAVPRLRRTARLPYAKLLAELRFLRGEWDEVASLLESERELRELDHGYLQTDLVNPWTASPFAHPVGWSEGFARRFQAADLEVPTFDGEQAAPFDRVRCSSTSRAGGPLISVVMTTFEPDEASLRTSVTSVLEQSWSDLELIVVDDHSSAERFELVEALADLDDRVRVLRMERNGGTYLARNAGIQAARGTFITGQDDDDWSHPRRLERQVEPLMTDPQLCATRSRSVTVLENLVAQRPGYPATRPNASSLMFRRATALRLGGFLPSRRGADSEFHHRLEAYSGTRVLTLDDPLALVRIRADSLSRGDFRAGWHHPARLTFRNAFERWHAVASPKELRVSPDRPAPIQIPARFQVNPEPLPDLDVVLIGDWRQYGGPQKSMIEEIHALRRAGMSVGVLHLEAPRFMSRKDAPLCAPVQDLINAGVVRRCIADEPQRARLAVLRYPPILQFAPAEPLALAADRVAILANQAPSERDGTDIRYDVATCSDAAEHVFGRRAVWVPQGPIVRSAIESDVRPGELTEFDLPGVLDIAEWRTDRSRPRGTRPVIGRHSRDNVMKWPERAQDVESIYPTDHSFDVRLMGGHSAVLKVLGRDRVPAAWVSFPKDALDVRVFLNSIDFFVYFQHSQAYDAFGRAVLEALAAGCVAVLPHVFRPTFGPAAIYCRPEDVRATVQTLWDDPNALAEQAERAMDFVARNFSYEAHVARVRDLLDFPAPS